MAIVNQVPLQVEQLTGRLAWEQRIEAVDDPTLLPGATNYARGGNLNAFIDAIDAVLQQGQSLGKTTFTFRTLDGGNGPGAIDITDFVRVNSVDPNPAEGTASGAELGDRIYIYDESWDPSSGSWIVALYNGFWYRVPPGHSPLNPSDPWADPNSTGPYVADYTKFRMPAGIIPMPSGENAVLWQPGINPELEPAGTILEVPEFPGPWSKEGEAPAPAPAETSWIPLALGAAALFLIMD